jgi:hypothetical protein
MRKSVCMTVLGFSLVVVAVSLGVSLTRLLGLLAYSPKGTAQAAASPAVPDNTATPPAEWNNLFAPKDGMRLASRLPAANGKGAPLATRSNFVLVGTIMSSSSAMRRAILWANGMKEPKAFREKEEIEPGARIASVERDKVWISRGKEREKLEILPVGSRGRPTGASVTAAAPSPAAPSPAAPSPTAPPGGTQAVGTPGASPVYEDGESLRSIQDRQRRLGGNRR